MAFACNVEFRFIAFIGSTSILPYLNYLLCATYIGYGLKFVIIKMLSCLFCRKVTLFSLKDLSLIDRLVISDNNSSSEQSAILNFSNHNKTTRQISCVLIGQRNVTKQRYYTVYQPMICVHM